MEQFRRTEKPKLKLAVLNRSPRDIDFIIDAWSKIDFIDRVWFKYFDGLEVINKINQFVKEHPEYTHFLLIADDACPTIEGCRQLIKDIEEYDFPVITGVTNSCNMYDMSDRICSWCKNKEEHPFLNITPIPASYIEESDGTLVQSSIQWHYSYMNNEWRKKNQGIYKIWMNGLGLCAVRRDILLQIPLRQLTLRLKSGGKGNNGSDDFMFAIDCAKHGIPQYVDTRVFMRHYGLYHNELLVNKKPRKIIIDRAISI